MTIPHVDFFVPDGLAPAEALARTTHLSISAHQDDIEIMAYHGVAECFGRADRWFTGVVATNGAGSPRAASTAITPTRDAARAAAGAAQSGLCRRLRLPDPAWLYQRQVKDPAETAVVDDLCAILRAAQPEVVYLHNLADKHDTHVATALRAIAALRAVRGETRPRKVYGCEVWRDLDWLPDEDKQALPVSRALQYRRRAGGRFRFPSERRQAL